MNQCPLCKQRVKRLTNHLAKMHNNNVASNQSKPSVRCPVCHESFEYGTMQAHLRREHTDSMGHVHGLRREIVGAPGKVSYNFHANSDGEREYSRRQEEERLDKIAISKIKAREEKL